MPDCEHACALIERNGALLLELRPSTARHAAGRLTCFGGKVEAGEDPEAALRRELEEELALTVRDLQPAIDLYKGSRWVARFFTSADSIPDQLCATDPATRALWIPWSTLPGVPLSPWHAAVLAAWRQGQSRVQLLAE